MYLSKILQHNELFSDSAFILFQKGAVNARSGWLTGPSGRREEEIETSFRFGHYLRQSTWKGQCTRERSNQSGQGRLFRHAFLSGFEIFPFPESLRRSKAKSRILRRRPGVLRRNSV